MTSSVTVNAHCHDNMEVEFNILNSDIIVDTRILQDGETASESIYGDRSVRVIERRKVDPPKEEKEKAAEKNLDEGFKEGLEEK